MRMKRVISVLLCLCVMLSTLAGIGPLKHADTYITAHAATGDYGTRTGTAPDIKDTGTFTDDVPLYTMYKDAYMNFVVYAYDYPTTTNAANFMQKAANIEFTFTKKSEETATADDKVGDTIVTPPTAVGSDSKYHVIPASWLIDPENEHKVLGETGDVTYQQLTRYNKDVFYHKIFKNATTHKGDSEGNVIVFTAGALKGLIVFCDSGYVFIAGFVASGVVVNSTASLGKISMDIATAGGPLDYAAFPAIDGNIVFDFKFSTEVNTGSGVNAPSIVADWQTGTGFAVSHGFATIENSDPATYYAIGFGPSASQGTKNNTNLSTWYPGTGDTLIIPFFGIPSNGASDSATSAGKYYMYTVPNTVDITTVTSSSARAPSGDTQSIYNTDFKQGGDNFTFPAACAMVSDGGFLTLNLTKGVTYTTAEALAGTFAHLRCIADGAGNDCVISSGDGMVSIIDPKVDVKIDDKKPLSRHSQTAK